jgi:hypothetical protein
MNSIPDIDEKSLNFILFEAPRFGARAEKVPIDGYSNRFGVRLHWTDKEGVERKDSIAYFSRYRMWWMKYVVHDNRKEHKEFWDAMQRKPPEETA